MQQLKFTLENERKTITRIPMPVEQEKKLIELIAQAILAHLKKQQEKKMNAHETDQKITPDHLARKAMIYLRQSSLQQDRKSVV